MLTAHNLAKRYGELAALRGVSMHIGRAEVVGIVGPSGAGKTTLLQILGTLERPDEGTLTLDEERPFEMGHKELARFRNRRLGFVFQFHNLLPEFTALENVAMPGLLAGDPRAQVMARATELLTTLGLAGRMAHRGNALSGGEQQRVAVARALLNAPSIILADEPSGNLDTANAQALHTLFFDLRDRLGQTFAIVTHNPALAERCDRVLHMRDGHIEREVTNRTVGG